jgi:hypothetical protein
LTAGRYAAISGYHSSNDITKWSLGAGGAISLLFFCDKLTNLGWLTLSILKYLMKTKKFICESA